MQKDESENMVKRKKNSWRIVHFTKNKISKRIFFKRVLFIFGWVWGDLGRGKENKTDFCEGYQIGLSNFTDCALNKFCQNTKVFYS